MQHYLSVIDMLRLLKNIKMLKWQKLFEEMISAGKFAVNQVEKTS